MLDGVNGPPTAPLTDKLVVGVTDSAPGVVLELTVRVADRVVLPAAFVVLVNVMVSPYVPAARELAPELIVAVTVVVAPAARVPVVALRVSQVEFFAAVHEIELPPVLVRV